MFVKCTACGIHDMGQLEIEGFQPCWLTSDGGGCHTQPGVECTAIPLPRGVGHGPAMARWRATPAHATRIPSVLTVDEVVVLLSALPTDMALLARLLYGTGMRLMEGLRLRVKDVDFDRGWSWYARPRATRTGCDAAAQPGSRAAPTGAGCTRAVGARSASAVRWRGRSACPGDQIPRRGQRWGWFWVFPLPPCRCTSHGCLAAASRL